MTRGRDLWVAIVWSAILYLLHKMEGRFPGSPPHAERYPDWHREMPGLLVSHEPFDSALHMAMTFGCQATVAALVLWVLRRALRAVERRPTTTGARAVVLAFSALWGGIAAFETHHVHKTLWEPTYYPGAIFAALFVGWTFLRLLPLVLTWHGLRGGAERETRNRAGVLEREAPPG